jgi:F-type H+-transporting ATPase subunit gamma
MERGRRQLALTLNPGCVNMTRRRNLERHRQSLAEIRDIMNSMKTLAYMETRKLARFLDAQHAVVQGIEDVATDLLSFYPEAMPGAKETMPVYVLIGTERGFCGDFNHALLKYLESALQEHPPVNPVLIAIGRKLYTLLEGDVRVAAQIDGASVVEEVTSVLSQVVGELSSLQEQHRMLTVYGLYHGGEDGIIMQQLLPPFQRYLHQTPHFPHPPVLNQSPREFLAELTDHYLFAAQHEMLYTSLMAENHRRVAHLEGAVKHLDDESAELVRQCNVLRQAEIIEEIEVILISAASLGENPGTQDYSSSPDK